VAFPHSFETARLSAERLTAAHVDALRIMDTDPDFMALLGGVREADTTAAYLERNLEHWKDHGFGLWILHEKAEHRLAGRACLRHLPIDDADEVEVGYGFHPGFWGRGLATEIAAACLQYAAATLRLPSVVAITQPANQRSRHVLSKVGLVYERDIDHEGLRHVLYRTPSKPTA